MQPAACEPGCSACGFNWYKMNWRAGNPTPFWDGPLGCNCCNTTPPQLVTCRRVCVLDEAPGRNIFSRRQARHQRAADGSDAATPHESSRPASVGAMESAMPRIAIQLSGHLKDVCRTDHYHERWTLLQESVKDCRRVATCDVFLATFSTLFPVASKHDVGSLEKILPTDVPPHDEYNISHGYWRSWACIAELEKRIGGVVAVAVDVQPKSIVKALGNATMFRGSFKYLSTRGGVAHWMRVNATSPSQLRRGTSPLLAGVRASVHAIASASRLRRAHCATFGCEHDLVVRMRPDLYKEVYEKGHRVQSEWLSQGGMLGRSSWDTVAHVARALRRDHNTSASSAAVTGRGGGGVGAGGAARAAGALRTVFGCHQQMLPGDKGVDNCWWGLPSVIDRLADEEDEIAAPFLLSNLCWGRWVVHGAPGAPPLAECGPRWLNCSRLTGCIAEDLLRVSIARIGAGRAPLPSFRRGPDGRMMLVNVDRVQLHPQADGREETAPGDLSLVR